MKKPWNRSARTLYCPRLNCQVIQTHYNKCVRDKPLFGSIDLFSCRAAMRSMEQLKTAFQLLYHSCARNSLGGIYNPELITKHTERHAALFVPYIPIMQAVSLSLCCLLSFGAQQHYAVFLWTCIAGNAHRERPLGHSNKHWSTRLILRK